MSKLYWRIKDKQTGKWTWKAALRHPPGDYTGKNDNRILSVFVYKEDEE